MAKSDPERLSALEAQFCNIAVYMEEGRRYNEEGRVWREDTSVKLATVINQQANYQSTCEKDRAEQKEQIVLTNSRVKTLEAEDARQAGKASILTVLWSGLIAMAISIITALTNMKYGAGR